jgi:hypothetical protein
MAPDIGSDANHRNRRPSGVPDFKANGRAWFCRAGQDDRKFPIAVPNTLEGFMIRAER